MEQSDLVPDMRPPLSVDNLPEVASRLAPGAIVHWLENFTLAMELAGHVTGANLTVRESDTDTDTSVSLVWSSTANERIRRTYTNQNARTEKAAEAMALVALPAFAGHTVVHASHARGNRIDFHTLPSDLVEEIDDMYIFNHPESKYLEVSGIDDSPGWSDIRTRVNKKVARLDTGHGPGSTAGVTFVFVAEFSGPKARLVLV